MVERSSEGALTVSRSTGKFAFVAIVCACLLLHTAAAGAQTAGSIAGVVRDASGAVVPGVTVEVASPALIEKARSVTTDGQGNYRVVDLPSGVYSVTFSLTGFNTVRREGINVTSGFAASVNGDLTVGTVEQAITVTGAAPVVDVQNVRSQNVLSNEVMETLPTGKSIASYASLTLGASYTAAFRDVGGNQNESANNMIAIHGLAAGNQKMLQDGMEITGAQGAGGGSQKLYNINSNFVNEVAVGFGGMSAETETSGVQINTVPKDGGNRFSVDVSVNGSNPRLQSDNLTDALVARGATTPANIQQLYDVGGGFGGPLIKDKLWFYTADRGWVGMNYVPGLYYNKTQGTPVYTPDLSRPASTGAKNWDQSQRITWQAAPKHKLAFTENVQWNCICTVTTGTQAPEAVRTSVRYPVSLTQATWQSPLSSRLLLEAGGTGLYQIRRSDNQPEVRPGDLGYTETSTGFGWGMQSGSTYTPNSPQHQANARFSASYVTGSHTFKTGVTWGWTYFKIPTVPWTEPPINLRLLGGRDANGVITGVGNSLTEFAEPNEPLSESTKLAVFTQDQWTMKRLTLNLGVRFDTLHGWNPAQTRPAGYFTPAIDFPKLDNVPNWKDITPRLGASYDLFGNGKTAVKVYVGKYLSAEATNLASNANPANSIVQSVTRNWTDGNNNFYPDCDLKNPLENSANGDTCGQVSNLAFGTVVQNTFYDPDVTEGWGKRGYSWQESAVLEQELSSRLAVTVGYYRTTNGNFTVTDNTLVTPADYDPYCITIPNDPRLPGAGTQTCGFYDISVAKRSQTNNLVTFAKNFPGERSNTYNGVDVGFNARLGEGKSLRGGVSTGSTRNVNCTLSDSPNVRFCDSTTPWKAGTQVKLNGTYPLPWWGISASGVFQFFPSIADPTTYTARNAELIGLGRNLSSCGTAATCNATVNVGNLYDPNSVYTEKGQHQIDLRLTKSVRIGRNRIAGQFDVYNLTNESTVLSVRSAYAATGTSYLQPLSLLAGRIVKFGMTYSY